MVSDGEIAQYVGVVGATLGELLGDGFVGLYLHGSLAMAAFQPMRSDIDLLATADAPISDALRDGLLARIGTIPLPTAASGLDLTVLPTEDARQPTERTRWEAAIQVRHALPKQEVRTLERSDPLLFVDVALVRQYGIVLAGPSIKESFGPVAPGLILRSCVENCRTWADRDVFNDPVSAVLNVCRAWRYLKAGELVSKPEAGKWARSKVDDTTLLDAALTRRRGDGSPSLPHADVKTFCQSVLRLFDERDLA